MAIVNLREDALRAKNLGLLFKVEKLLSDAGLDGEIVGSALQRGNYHDIDIKVGPANSWEKTNLIWALSSQNMGITTPEFEEGIAVKWLPAHGNEKYTRYINTFVEQRFKIRQGKTVIDLCFEAAPQDRDRFEEYLGYIMPSDMMEHIKSQRIPHSLAFPRYLG